MFMTDCDKCIHGDLCKIRDQRQTLFNMVSDQLGPHFDLYCKEWKDKDYEANVILANLYADNRPISTLTTRDFLYGNLGSAFCSTSQLQNACCDWFKR